MKGGGGRGRGHLARGCREACYDVCGEREEEAGRSGQGHRKDRPDVLSGKENTEGQSIQEISRGEQSSDGAETEAGLSLQELGDVLGLGHTGVAIAAVSSHEGQGVEVFVARIFLMQVRESVIDSTPEGRRGEGNSKGGGTVITR
jgi:hypothetical protein